MQTKFPDYSKADWLAKVEKDLKGKPIEGLDFELANKTYAPFFHREDLEKAPPSISKSTSAIGIGLRINAQDPVEANKIALAALAHGANEICFFYSAEPHLEEGIDEDKFMADLLHGIHLEMVKIHVQVYSEAGDNIKTLGSKVYHADAAFNGPMVNISGAMISALQNMAHVIDHEIYDKPFRVNFWLNPTNDFFYSIAAFRAIRLCWQRLAEVIPACSPDCTISAHIRRWHGQDLHAAKINTTAQSMAAIIGGADALFPDPFDTSQPTPDDRSDVPGNDPENFGRRIALNVQHILQLESYLDSVQDPAAGSYYLETLTDDLAHQLWALLQKKLNNLSPRTRLYKLLQAGDSRILNPTFS